MPTETDIGNFLNNLNIPQLGAIHKDYIYTPISKCDLLEAFGAFPSGKSAGPNCFRCKIYKTFHEEIVPIILRMVNDTVKNKMLSSLYEANICLL